MTNLMQQAFRIFNMLAQIAILVRFMGITSAHDKHHGTHPGGRQAARRGNDTQQGSVDGSVWCSTDGHEWRSDGTGFWRGPLAPFLELYDQYVGYRLTFMLPVAKIMVAWLIVFLTSQLAAFYSTLCASPMRILDATNMSEARHSPEH